MEFLMLVPTFENFVNHYKTMILDADVLTIFHFFYGFVTLIEESVHRGRSERASSS
jgi:hypothetical protein